MARILIVDDDESVARVLTHFLREAGHAPSVASNGHLALPLLYRLISTGSNPLVRQVCRRLGTDRARGNLSRAVETASWTEIIRRATQEGLLEEAECGALLQGVPFRPVEQTA